MKNMLAKTGFITLVILFFFLFFLPQAKADVLKVNCDNGKKIQKKLDLAVSGDVIKVRGTCSENITIITSSITLKAASAGATLDGPDSTTATILVIGRNVTIKGFDSISGGANVILVVSRASAIIENNTIENGTFNGIVVNRGAVARIIDNTIQNNTFDGIRVGENSVARIGFLFGSDTVARPNTIQGNGDDGIDVRRSSSARIVGNNINNNTDDGINVRRVSHADISDNDIDNNGDEGIFVHENSGVNLGSDTGTTIFQKPNRTDTTNNGDAGIRCSINSYANGRVGTLNGTISGAKSFAGSCIDSLI